MTSSNEKYSNVTRSIPGATTRRRLLGIGTAGAGAAIAGVFGKGLLDSTTAFASPVPGEPQVSVGKTVVNVSSLRALIGKVDESVLLEGYAAPGDGGGGTFVWSTSTVLSDDGGTVFTSGGLDSPGVHGCWRRSYDGGINVAWFGLDRTGANPNDEVHSRMLASPACADSTVFYYPPGDYLFADTIGPWPYGSRIVGSGIVGGDTGAAGDIHLGGTTLLFSGMGVGVELSNGNQVDIIRSGTLFEGFEILGVNPNGESSYPNINEIGLEVLNECAVVRLCRFGGFKFSISLDGAEVTAIEACNFDGAPPSNLGYPESELTTDNGIDSAFAIRLGTWKSQAGLACNQIEISNCQFNNTYWGLLHAGGYGHHVHDCNFEQNIAILTSPNLNTVYDTILGEGALSTNLLTTGTNYNLTLRNMSVTQSQPLITFQGPQYGLNLYDNFLFRSTCAFPVVNSDHIIGGVAMGNAGPNGDGDSAKGVIFDSGDDPESNVVGPLMIVGQSYSDGDTVNSALGVGGQPISPLDVEGNRIRIRQSYTPVSSSDPFGNEGDLCWDGNYLYVKTSSPGASNPSATSVWVRSSLESF